MLLVCLKRQQNYLSYKPPKSQPFAPCHQKQISRTVCFLQSEYQEEVYSRNKFQSKDYLPYVHFVLQRSRRHNYRDFLSKREMKLIDKCYAGIIKYKLETKTKYFGSFLSLVRKMKSYWIFSNNYFLQAMLYFGSYYSFYLFQISSFYFENF